MKKITVLTITYNKGKYNIASVESILNQTYQDFNYIVVNDGSNDNTKELLDSIRHPNLTVIHQKNQGFTNTLVNVASHIDTPYVAIHGAGDISHPERLEKQLDFLESDQSLGAIGCHVRRLSDEGNILNHSRVPFLTIHSVEDLFEKLGKSNYFRHGEVMFRYSIYKKAGGYRQFFKYTQDYDLWLRMLSFAKLARIDSFLYDQVNIPQSSINCDYKKVEIQATLNVFAWHLAQQRLKKQFDALDLEGLVAFEKFKNSLSQQDKMFISNAVMITAKQRYYQTADYKILLEGAQRAIELNPDSYQAKRNLKLAYLTTLLDWLGFKEIAKQLNNKESNLVKNKLAKLRKLLKPHLLVKSFLNSTL